MDDVVGYNMLVAIRFKKMYQKRAKQFFGLPYGKKVALLTNMAKNH